MNREDTQTQVLKGLKEEGITGDLANRIATKVMSSLTFDSDLVALLHANCRHPLFEYATTESGRSDSDPPPPEGAGWEVNFDKDRGYYKHDNYVDNFWRRESKHRLTDNVSVEDLPPVAIPKRSFAEVLQRLREELFPDTIRGGKGSKLTHKPEYHRFIASFFNGGQPGLAAYSPDSFAVEDVSLFPFKPREQSVNSPNYILLAPVDHPFEILIDGQDPEDNSWIRVKTLGGALGDWTRVVAMSRLPIHPIAWEALTDMI